MLGSVSGELGLRKFLESRGHQLVVTSDKDRPNSKFDQELVDADVVISQPFWPAYLTRERIAKAPKLKLALTAGIGSDHVDLQAAIERGITVAEETWSNSISVAEHAAMMIISLVRDYIPAHDWARNGGWNIADCVQRSYDVEGMQLGAVGAGRIGVALMRRMKPFDMKLHYFDHHRQSAAIEQELGLIFHPSVEDLVQACDVVSIQCPLTPETRHMFNDALIGKMKRGAYIVNCGRGEICDENAVVRALESGRPRGIRGRCVVPATRPQGPPLADDAP
ncbi:MAG: NAD-dependent formate dehydrogenase [Acetobacteraceae bacterium]